MWKKNLNASPLQFASNHMCSLSIDLNSTSATPRFISILGIYMPCSEQCQDVYRNYFESVEYQLSHNPLLIMGDLNAHLNVSSSDHNRRGAVWNNLIETYQLCDLSTSQLAFSPGFTYYSGARHTTIEYIFGNQEAAQSVTSCQTVEEHPLNTSDHLSICCFFILAISGQSLHSPSLNILWIGEQPIKIALPYYMLLKLMILSDLF